MIVLIPKEGMRVRDPVTKKVLGPEGVRVERITTYWHRRIRDGEVEAKEASKAKPAQKVQAELAKAEPKKPAQQKEKGE